MPLSAFSVSVVTNLERAKSKSEGLPPHVPNTQLDEISFPWFATPWTKHKLYGAGGSISVQKHMD